MKTRHLALVLSLLLVPVPGSGQTVLDAPPAKPDGAPPAAGGESDPAASGPRLGRIDYPDLHQPGRISAGTATIQSSWNSASGTAGIAEYRFCASCVYRVRVRELMVTTIVLPAGRVIGQIDLGDPVGFEVQPRGSGMLAVRPRSIGIDTNLNVYTDKGVMTFYLRAEGFDSGHVPDLVVRIGPDGTLAGPREGPVSRVRPQAGPGSVGAPRSGGGGAVAGSRAHGTGFDPARLRGWGDYSLKGDAALRPETVFRDDHFTYIHFGGKWPDLDLPVAFVVVDGIDETVNTRVMGRTLVVESTAPVISLKSGERYLCIEYEGGRE